MQEKIDYQARDKMMRSRWLTEDIIYLKKYDLFKEAYQRYNRELETFAKENDGKIRALQIK